METELSLETKYPHTTILLLMGTIAAVFTVLMVQVSSVDVTHSSTGVIAGFCLNLLVAVISLVKESSSRAFSLAQVHWLFVIVFMCIAPCSQYLNGFACWNFQLSEGNYETTNFLVFIWEIMFIAGGVLGRKKESTLRSLDMYDLPVRKGAVNLSLLLSLLCTLLLIQMVGFGNLFARSTFSLGLDQTSSLVAQQLLRGIPVFVFVISWIRWQRYRDCLAHVVFALTLMLISAFPFGLSRYSMAVIYGGLCIFCFPVLCRKRGLFPLLFLLTFLVLFPASNAFRANDFSIQTLFEASVSAITRLDTGFLTEDYDAYSMLYRAWSYVSSYGATSGYQLLGVFLFFVPRAVWPSKPVGSGYMIAESQHQVFLNVSCPFPGEGVVNFGIVGLIAFALIGSLMTRKIDEALWTGALRKWLKPFYPFAVMFVFFIMRGDMLSSFSYLVGFFAAFCVVVVAVRVFASAIEGRDDDLDGDLS